MGGLSRAAWTLLEQLTSTDLQTGFRLLGRDVLEGFRFLAFDRAVVLGGLEASANPGGVSIAPGALLQPYPGGSSSPGADESGTVFGRLGAAQAVAIANPGADTWYTIVARWAERDTRAPRLVALNATTGAFTPQDVIVQREAWVEFSVVTGTTTALAAAPTGWIPIAGVLRRTSGATLPGDVYDLRPLAQHFAPIRPPVAGVGAIGEEHFEQQDYAVTAMGPPSIVRFDVELVDRQGLRLSAHGSAPLASLLGPGVVLQTSRWFYLYLAPWRGVAPKTATGRGFLVLSDVAPYAQGSRQNGAPINVLAPHVYAVPQGEATCVGALRTTSFEATQLTQQACVHGCHLLGRSDVQLGATSVLLAHFVPINARSARFSVKIGGSDPQTFALYAPDGAFAVPLLEATNILSMRLSAGDTHHLLPPMGLMGITTTQIATVGYPTGSEIALREFEV